MENRSISSQARVAEKVVRSRAGGEASGKSAQEIRIPELYRTPTPDREMQGCMKARA